MNFPPPGDAKAVLAMMQGSMTPDVVMAMQRQQAASAPAAAGGGGQQQQQRGSGGAASKPKFVPGKVFLGGTSTDTTRETLSAYASQWGALADIYCARGFAFITFEDPVAAQAFLEHRNHVINGKPVEAKAAVPKEDGGSRLSKKLFVGGVSEVSDEEFRAYFARFGSIVHAVVLRNPDGTSRRYGFVTFDDEISVEKALVQEHYLSGHRVEVKRSHSNRDGGGGGGEQQQQQHSGRVGSTDGAGMSLPAPSPAGMVTVLGPGGVPILVPASAVTIPGSAGGVMAASGHGSGMGTAQMLPATRMLQAGGSMMPAAMLQQMQPAGVGVLGAGIGAGPGAASAGAAAMQQAMLQQAMMQQMQQGVLGGSAAPGGAMGIPAAAGMAGLAQMMHAGGGAVSAATLASMGAGAALNPMMAMMAPGVVAAAGSGAGTGAGSLAPSGGGADGTAAHAAANFSTAGGGGSRYQDDNRGRGGDEQEGYSLPPGYGQQLQTGGGRGATYDDSYARGGSSHDYGDAGASSRGGSRYAVEEDGYAGKGAYQSAGYQSYGGGSQDYDDGRGGYGQAVYSQDYAGGGSQQDAYGGGGGSWGGGRRGYDGSRDAGSSYGRDGYADEDYGSGRGGYVRQMDGDGYDGYGRSSGQRSNPASQSRYRPY